MKLIGKVAADRPLLVVAVEEEAQAYDGDLPLLLTGLGKVNAATSLAAVLAHGERPSRVVNLGTAGALQPGWSGTHEVGTIIQHDLDSELLHQLTGRPWGEPVVLPGDGPTLATGDVFVSDPVVRARLAARAELVDMEAYAVAVAARQAGVPVQIVKHVSDDAGEAATKTWRETVIESAQPLADWVAHHLAART